MWTVMSVREVAGGFALVYSRVNSKRRPRFTGTGPVA